MASSLTPEERESIRASFDQVGKNVQRVLFACFVTLVCMYVYVAFNYSSMCTVLLSLVYVANTYIYMLDSNLVS